MLNTSIGSVDATALGEKSGYNFPQKKEFPKCVGNNTQESGVSKYTLPQGQNNSRYLFCPIQCSKCFADTSSLNPHNSPMRQYDNAPHFT